MCEMCEIPKGAKHTTQLIFKRQTLNMILSRCDTHEVPIIVHCPSKRDDLRYFPALKHSFFPLINFHNTLTHPLHQSILHK